MGIFLSAMSGVMSGVGHTAKAALGGSFRRAALGAGIGAIYGAATSDSNTATGQFWDAAGGAIMGLGVGAAINTAKWSLSKNKLGSRPIYSLFNKSNRNRAFNTAKTGLKAGSAIGKVGLKVALNHPVAAVAGLGLLAGAGAWNNIQETGNIEFKGMNIPAEQLGLTNPGVGARARELASSTMGVINGLNDRRHG